MQESDEQLIYKIGLSLIDGIGPVTAKKLVAYCGAIEGIFTEKPAHLMKIPGVGPKLAKIVAEAQVLERAWKEMEYIQKNNIQTAFFLDADYPHRLKECPDGPVMLYSKGNFNPEKKKVVSIVGTRKATMYGKEICQKIVEELVPHDVLIVSGLAFGIDICAHRAALECGLSTAAVLAHGLDRLYPPSHASTASKMLENGGLISEFCSGTNPDRENFPRRNRVIAGLADATIVVESAQRGGSIITGELAADYNRDVFAVPGRHQDKYSAGCNWLIKTHKASLYESVKDLEYIMGWNKKKPATQQTINFDPLAPKEEEIVSFLKQKGISTIDDLSAELKLPMGDASAILLNLEFEGYIKALPGKAFALN